MTNPFDYSAEIKSNIRNEKAKSALKMGTEPFNRDNIFLAFGKEIVGFRGQSLSGTGALVFEGEELHLPSWN